MNATNNNQSHWTFNRDVPAFSKLDTYRYNPWRAPGNAPASDPSVSLLFDTPLPALL